MSDKKGFMGLAALAAAGAGAAMLMKKTREINEEENLHVKETTANYRNTERGKHDKNSKGIYYSNGNYEAFARPEKPEGVDDKHAYIVGSGLASLAAACFLVRDAQMPGDHIHILEAMDIAGGACDGIFDPSRGYIMRGGREMENHFECLWDLFRSIPSLEKPGASVLDEFYWLNKHDPNYSLCRATVNRGQDAHTDGKFNLSQKGCMEIMKLFMTKDEDLYDKTIEDVFDDEVFDSTFWLYWRTMFAFENWHSALEMKLYFQRFIHHIAGLPDFSALKFTKYNQYESLILPMKKYLEDAGVDFQFNTEVTNVIFNFKDGKKIATAIECKVKDVEQGILLTENDYVFVTNGSCTEVLAGRETRIARIMARDGLTQEYAALRVDAQNPDSFYESHCGTILQNAGTREQFARTADQYLTNILKGAFPMTKQEREALLYQPRHGRDRLTKEDEAAMLTYCEDYKAFLDRSKTERECVASAGTGGYCSTKARSWRKLSSCLLRPLTAI